MVEDMVSKIIIQPRRKWYMKPIERIKISKKLYNRKNEKSKTRKEIKEVE
jgi:hypothetical protein